MNSTLGVILVLIFALTISCKTNTDVSNKKHLRLWYEQPADALVKDHPFEWKDDPERPGGIQRKVR